MILSKKTLLQILDFCWLFENGLKHFQISNYVYSFTCNEGHAALTNTVLDHDRDHLANVPCIFRFCTNKSFRHSHFAIRCDILLSNYHHLAKCICHVHACDYFWWGLHIWIEKLNKQTQPITKHQKSRLFLLPYQQLFLSKCWFNAPFFKQMFSLSSYLL